MWQFLVIVLWLTAPAGIALFAVLLLGWPAEQEMRRQAERERSKDT